MTQEERYKWKVDGRQDWEDYQQAVQEEFSDWEEKLGELAKSREQERWVEGAWELWKAKMFKAADRGIGKKKVTERSKGWWSTDVEAAIQARKAVCKELREARRRGAQDEIVQRKWEKYRNKRKLVKKLIRKEKNEMRKRTMKKIREQGGPIASCFGLT